MFFEKRTYRRLVKEAMEVLTPFATIYEYLCELRIFNTCITSNTKNSDRLDVQYDVRVAFSGSTPQFNIITWAKEQQTSHRYVFKN